MRNRTAAGALVDGLIDQRARLEAIRIGLQVRMLFQMLQVQGGQQLEVETVIRRRNGDLTIGRFKQAVGGSNRMVVAGAQGLTAGGEKVGRKERQHAGHAVGQGGGNLLPLTGAAAPNQCRHDAHCRVGTGHQIRHRRGGAHRRLPFEAVDAHEAAHRLGDEIECRSLAVGPVQPEAGNVAADDVWLQGAQGIAAKAHFVHHPGPVIVDHHVGTPQQLA